MEKRKSRVKRERRVSDIKVLADTYSFFYVEKYKENPPAWFSKEFGQCKTLIKKLGDVDRADKLIRYVFKNWGWVSKEVGLSGAPLIGDILARCLGYAERAASKEGGKKDEGFGEAAVV